MLFGPTALVLVTLATSGWQAALDAVDPARFPLAPDAFEATAAGARLQKLGAADGWTLSIGPGPNAWHEQGLGGMRGVTIGPIENARHPGRGYGTDASARALDEAVMMGATWISVTPFGRVYNLSSENIDLTFEAPFDENRRNVIEIARQAHARGLRVMLVPHLWVEAGGWRAEIDPSTDDGWERWAASYEHFVVTWAEVATEAHIDLFSVGVELRSWVTTRRAASFGPIIERVRSVYPGLLTYSANWDDVEHTLIFDQLDLIGINAFYPLAQREQATADELVAEGRNVARGVGKLAEMWSKPVVLTEIGYTNRQDPALRPWEWPESLEGVVLDEQAQADAYRGILAPFIAERWCAGVFVWRLYADPDDVSQEPAYGFSPRGKKAELVMRDAFAAYWAADGPYLPAGAIGRDRSGRIGVYGPSLFEPSEWLPQL